MRPPRSNKLWNLDLACYQCLFVGVHDGVWYQKRLYVTVWWPDFPCIYCRIYGGEKELKSRQDQQSTHRANTGDGEQPRHPLPAQEAVDFTFLYSVNC
jgi:hypothetical protein